MEEKSSGNKNLQIIAGILMALSIVIVSYGIFMYFNDKKDKNTKYVPNEITLNDFDISILKSKNKTNNDNLVYSPLSIKSALSMLREGANGSTKKEIVSLIGDLTPSKYKDIENTLSFANSLFIRDTYKKFVNEDFIKTLEDNYNSEVFYDSFVNASNINNWVKEKTFNLINNVVSDELVQNDDLEMILINALAIDMEWTEEFDVENTYSRPFTKSDGSSIDVAMMNKSSKSQDNLYYQDKEYNVISLPLKKYEDTKLDFIAIMPRVTDLNTFVESDNYLDKVNELIDKIHKVDKEEISISIPRFTFEYSLNLNDDLKKLGVVKIFDPIEADFSNLSSSGLYVKDILHKSNIKFSEKGIKAGAATTIFMTDRAKPIENEIKYLNFDKPFMFVIRDNKKDEIWFMGTVYEPQLWEDVKSEYKYE